MANYEIRVIPKVDASGATYWTAFFPAIDGCVGGGSTAEEAIREAEENLEIYLEYLESENIDIPTAYEETQYSGKIALRVSKSTHRKLAEKSADEGVSVNMIINNAIEHYLGMSEYNCNLDAKISNIQAMTGYSIKLQQDNCTINQQLLWNQVHEGVPVTVFEGEE